MTGEPVSGRFSTFAAFERFDQPGIPVCPGYCCQGKAHQIATRLRRNRYRRAALADRRCAGEIAMTVQHRRAHDIAPPAPPALHALICALWAAPVALALAIIAYTHAPASRVPGDRPTLVRNAMQPAPLHVGEPAGPGFFVHDSRHGSVFASRNRPVAQEGLGYGIVVSAGFETGPMPPQPAVSRFAPWPGHMNELRAGVSGAAGTPVDETRDFSRAHPVNAIAIRADGVVVQIAGIVSPRPEARCERLDGVIESCQERARGRLAVVLQGRNLSCHLTRRLAAGSYVGVCRAGAIDLATDLLRFRLVERQTVPSADGIPAGASL